MTASATRIGTNKRDDQMGWGLVDPLAALAELDARSADMKVARPATEPAPAPTTVSTRDTSAAPAPAAASSSRATLPRPGMFPPRP